MEARGNVSFSKVRELAEAKHLLSLSHLIGLNSHGMGDLKGLEGFLTSESLAPALSFREDKHLLHRTTAQEIMLANKWALNNERKDLAFVLLGLSPFDEPLDIEQKTLERSIQGAGTAARCMTPLGYP